MEVQTHTGCCVVEPLHIATQDRSQRASLNCNAFQDNVIFRTAPDENLLNFNAVRKDLSRIAAAHSKSLSSIWLAMWTAAVSEKKSSIRVTDFAPPLQKAEDAVREKPTNWKEEKAPASPERNIPRTVSSELGSRALAGLPMGAQTGTSGGLLFSAYKKQPMSSIAGSGSGPGPKKMKITLKKK